MNKIQGLQFRKEIFAVFDFDDVLYHFSVSLYNFLLKKTNSELIRVPSKMLLARGEFYLDKIPSLFLNTKQDDLRNLIMSASDNLYSNPKLINDTVFDTFEQAFPILLVKRVILTHTLPNQISFKNILINNYFKPDKVHHVSLSQKKSHYINTVMKHEFSILFEDSVDNIIDICTNSSHYLVNSKNNPFTIMIPRRGWNGYLEEYLNNKLKNLNNKLKYFRVIYVTDINWENISF